MPQSRTCWSCCSLLMGPLCGLRRGAATAAVPEDELRLARLTASKLARVLHGLLSVGTGALELERPADFLAGREQTPLGFLEVLRCTGVRAGHADKLVAGPPRRPPRR